MAMVSSQKKKSEGVVALGDAREHHLQAKKKLGVDNVNKDPVVFLRESHELDVVAKGSRASLRS